VRATAASVVSDTGSATVLVADAYAAMVVMSRAVYVADMGADGNVVAVADAGAVAEAGTGVTVTGPSRWPLLARPAWRGCTTTKGDADCGAAGAEGGGVACGVGVDGDSAGCQGRDTLTFSFILKTPNILHTTIATGLNFREVKYFFSKPKWQGW
jgi:hypothetical protein